MKSLWVLLLTSVAFGQSAVAVKAPLAFEVASVKPAPPPDRAQTMGRPLPAANLVVDDARVYIASATLGELINMAFRVRPYQVEGPRWLTATGASALRFTVQAKLPEGATKDQAPEMLQALLAERFHLAVHREQKERAVFALVIGKGGSKLQESVPDAESAAAGEMGKGPTNQKVMQTPGGNTIHVEQDLTIVGLCDLATRFLDRPVVDMTELKGRYHMVVELSIDDMRTIASRNGSPTATDGAKPDTAADPTGGTIFQSVQAMGLKLEPRRMTVSQLLIDQVEKSPVEN